MSISGKSAVLVGALAVAAAPLAGTVAEAKTRAARTSHYAVAPYQPSVRVGPDGSNIDSQGRRHWNGQWDNSCFRALGYLNSVDACGGHSGAGG